MSFSKALSQLKASNKALLALAKQCSYTCTVDRARVSEFTKTFVSRALLPQSTAPLGKPYPSVDKSVLHTLVKYAQFADSVYYDIDSFKYSSKIYGFQVLCHYPISRRMKPAYAISYNTETRVVLIQVKGTKTVEDILTDVNVDAKDFDGGYGHSGVLSSSDFIYDEVHFTLKTLFPRDYQIIVIGHSLGGSVAAVTSLLLHQYGLPVSCVSYGPMPCVSADIAKQCDEFVISVVNKDDIVPRATSAVFRRMGESMYDDMSSARDSIIQVIPEFLKSDSIGTGNESTNSKLPGKPMYLPGRVVYMDGFGNCVELTKESEILQNINPSPRFISDHLMKAYIKALSELKSI